MAWFTDAFFERGADRARNDSVFLLGGEATQKQRVIGEVRHLQSLLQTRMNLSANRIGKANPGTLPNTGEECGTHRT